MLKIGGNATRNISQMHILGTENKLMDSRTRFTFPATYRNT